MIIKRMSIFVKDAVLSCLKFLLTKLGAAYVKLVSLLLWMTRGSRKRIAGWLRSFSIWLLQPHKLPRALVFFANLLDPENSKPPVTKIIPDRGAR